METKLLSGRFSTDDAQQLLTRLYQTKIDFHAARINTADMAEEDIKHLEKKIVTLQGELNRIVKRLQIGDFQHVALDAKVVIEFCPDYYNAVPPVSQEAPAGVSAEVHAAMQAQPVL